MQLVGDDDQIVTLCQFGQAFELVSAPDPAGRIVRMTPEQYPSVGLYRRFESLEIQPPRLPW
ncbi:hypothetical protein GCM10009038_14900 [Salinicola rhizosphaerae]|uniref:Uncharacterized protein n=1 Tax=Salinicola rhizosphaerae TaxID=1443141 RepID=A0ABQ3DUU5_9GAMM|nr:hypothetical protein GCM10009038_14900 [Salinicola rhizosphaerae]